MEDEGKKIEKEKIKEGRGRKRKEGGRINRKTSIDEY